MKLTILAIMFSIVTAVFLPEVTFEKQEKLHASLLQLSSIILAITGAWAAIVYPDAIQSIIKKHDSVEKFIHVNNLIKPMLVSLIILGILVLSQISSFILVVIEPDKDIMLIAEKTNLSLLIFLYLLQIYSTILAFLPISDAQREASIRHKENNLLDSLNDN